MPKAEKKDKERRKKQKEKSGAKRRGYGFKDPSAEAWAVMLIAGWELH